MSRLWVVVDPRPNARERSRERLHDEIGIAARRLFAQQGYAGTTVEQVAEAAGVSARTVFRHFPRKEDLPFHRHAAIRARFAALLAADPGGRSTLDVLSDALWAAVGVDTEPQTDAQSFLRLVAEEPELRRHEQALFGDQHVDAETYLLRHLSGPGAARRAKVLAGAFMAAAMAARELVLAEPHVTPRAQLDRAMDELRPLDWPVAAAEPPA